MMLGECGFKKSPTIAHAATFLTALKKLNFPVRDRFARIRAQLFRNYA